MNENPVHGYGPAVPRRIPLPLIAALVAVVLLLVGGVIGLVVLLSGRTEVAGTPVAAPAPSSTAVRMTAEQVAAKYAAGAAATDYRDLAQWRAALKWHTAPELAARLDAVEGSMGRLLTDLQWVSTASVQDTVLQPGATPQRAVARVYVRVHSVSAQNPAGTDSLTTYVITMDPSRDNLITDIAGAGAGGTPGAGATTATTPAAPTS